MKKHAPATLRNREPILAILEQELPKSRVFDEKDEISGHLLEIASGSGEHALFFAERFPALNWQPSDPDPDAVASIAAYCADYKGKNLSSPIVLDASAPENWAGGGKDLPPYDAILCINMVHISPWSATQGLFEGAARILGGKNLPVILYGPYFEDGVETAPSNIAFDESLRSRNGQWGIRRAEDLDRLAQSHGFARSARYEMPANNLMLIYRSA